MARVDDIPSDALPDRLAGIYEAYSKGYGPFRNQAAVLAHVPPALDHLCSLLMELKERKAVPWRYIELAIVAVSKLNECDYCVAHHKPMARIEGLSDAAIDNVLDPGNPELTDIDRLVVEYATLVTQTPGRIRDQVFERLGAHFTPAQIVELTLRIALCGFFNRFNDALMIDEEPEAEEALVASAGH